MVCKCPQRMLTMILGPFQKLQMHPPHAERHARFTCCDATTRQQHESANPQGQKCGEFPYQGLLAYPWPLCTSTDEGSTPFSTAVSLDCLSRTQTCQRLHYFLPPPPSPMAGRQPRAGHHPLPRPSPHSPSCRERVRRPSGTRRPTSWHTRTFLRALSPAALFSRPMYSLPSFSHMEATFKEYSG